MSFTGNYTSPVNLTSPSRASPVFVSVSVNVPPLRPISGSGSLVSPLSLSARPLSVSSPICAGHAQISPTSPPSRASSASRNTSRSSCPSSPRSSGGSGVIKVVPRGQEQQVVEDRGSPGPIFEAAMEKQRQRQYARIRRSFRTAQRYANAAVAAAAVAAQRESSDSQQCYHLPSQRLTRSPYPVVGGEDEIEDEPGESERTSRDSRVTRPSWGSK
ncbi:hypothetical protein F5887DRAFT_932080 [Amanita rubescens]|nr:hypothetical protein F5887DRAFT_932080 [Amanita rubescens]